MTLPPIDTLREEHRADGIGPKTYSLLKLVVEMTAVRYPPQIYGAASRWDEGTLNELLHDWILERLMRGDLSMMIASSATTEALRNQLATSLRQLIINRRRRDSAGNLYRRTMAILKGNDRFVQIAPISVHRAPWVLADEEQEGLSKLDLRALVKVAFELSDEDLEVVRYGPHSLKSSPILREPQLERFLIHLLQGAEGALTPSEIAHVMQHRFSLVREREVELDAQIGSEELVEMRIESEALAAAAMSHLTATEAERVRFLIENDWNVRAAASASGEVEEVLRLVASRVSALAAEFAEDPDQAAEILTKVGESLFMEGAR